MTISIPGRSRGSVVITRSLPVNGLGAESEASAHRRVVGEADREPVERDLAGLGRPGSWGLEDLEPPGEEVVDRLRVGWAG